MSRTYEQLEPVIKALDDRIKTGFGAFPTDTAEGSIASFADGADGIPLKSLVVNIDPVQDTSSGDPSPTNICPISGWTGANVTRCGKNLWDEEWEMGTLDVLTGAEIVSSVTMRSKNFIRVKPGMKCMAVGQYNVVNTNQFIICYYDKDGSYVNYISLVKPGPFNIPSDERIALMRFAYRYYLHDSGGIYNSDVSVNYPSTATAYEPYNTDSEFIDISFPTEAGTVYGGSLDVLSGVLTVYPYYASYNGETLTGRWISDRDVYAVGTTPTIGAQVVNIGAEGTEIQLSPTEVKSLLGQNNIFADTGDTEVEYRADTKLYIERLIEPDADMIADANITSGSYFMVGNTLYKATANIASGSAVIEGTNATRKSLSEALNEINQ